MPFITQEEAERIEKWKNNKEKAIALKMNNNFCGEDSVLNKMLIDDFVKALYLGYRIW